MFVRHNTSDWESVFPHDDVSVLYFYLISFRSSSQGWAFQNYDMDGSYLVPQVRCPGLGFLVLGFGSLLIGGVGLGTRYPDGSRSVVALLRVRDLGFGVWG